MGERKNSDAKPLKTMSNAKFRRYTLANFGFDALKDRPMKPPEPYRGTDELIDKYRRKDPVRNDHLLRELAIAKLAHMDFGEGSPYASIRFELLDIIASKLKQEAKLVRDGEARTAARRRMGSDQWKADDVQIRQIHPDWSDMRRARKISKERGGKVDTIRKVIARKK